MKFRRKNIWEEKEKEQKRTKERIQPEKMSMVIEEEIQGMKTKKSNFNFRYELKWDKHEGENNKTKKKYFQWSTFDHLEL